MAIAFAMAAAISGCAWRPARPRPSLPVVLPSADALLGGVAARRRAISGVRAIARISYESGEERIGSRHAIVVVPPGRFRLEVLSPLGAVAVVTCDASELAVWVRREHATYRGAATAASIAAYTGVPVSAADAVSVLSGLPPDRPITASPIVTGDEAGLLRVSAPTDGGKQDVWFAADSGLPVASETTLDDPTRVLRVEFADYRTIDGVAFPMSIDMRLDAVARRVRIRYEPPTIGGVIAPDVFALPVRPGVEERRLDTYAGASS